MSSISEAGQRERAGAVDAGDEGSVPALTAADVSSALSALGVDAAPLTRSEYSLAELLDEVVGRTPTCSRSRCTSDESLPGRRLHGRAHRCRAGERSTRTIAIESEDPTRVIGTVRELGLAMRPNVNYARGLKTLTGFGVERFAVIDIGTNSVKLHVSERRRTASADARRPRRDHAAGRGPRTVRAAQAGAGAADDRSGGGHGG